MTATSTTPSHPLTSRLTGGPVDKLFTARVLHKYEVSYYRCRDTGFIQTEYPYWLNEAYVSPIADLDVGYVERNIHLAAVTAKVIENCFDPDARFLDYGGGYGMFVRLMRDRGFDFYRLDPFTKNLFAPYFEFDRSLPQSQRLELGTAFEVLEHLPDPMAEIGEMLRLCDTLLLSTELLPAREFTSADDWWYFSPEHGQHVAFYTEKSLQFIAQRFNVRLISTGTTLHLLTRKADIAEPFASIPGYVAHPRSLIQRDHAMILNILRSRSPGA